MLKNCHVTSTHTIQQAILDVQPLLSSINCVPGGSVKLLILKTKAQTVSSSAWIVSKMF